MNKSQKMQNGAMRIILRLNEYTIIRPARWKSEIPDFHLAGLTITELMLETLQWLTYN